MTLTKICQKVKQLIVAFYLGKLKLGNSWNLVQFFNIITRYLLCRLKYFQYFVSKCQLLILTQQERGNFSMRKYFKLKKILSIEHFNVGIFENQL